MPLARLPRIRFELDPRLELLSELLLLARPKERRRVSALSCPYAEKTAAHAAAFAGHPAAAEFGRLLDRGVPEHLFTEMILLQPDRRRLQIEPRRSRGLLSQSDAAREMTPFFEALRGFGAASAYEAFFRSRRREHEKIAAFARAEAERGQRPEDLAAYLRMPFSRTYRLILTPLLPQAFAANVSLGREELRVRNGFWSARGFTFEYDVFDCSVAHELTHTAVAPMVASSRAVFDSFSAGPPKMCRDSASWSGCVEEHLVRALTLRALKASGGAREYRTILRRWSRAGYPYLPWFCGRLEGFEASPKRPDFAAFYPGLAAAFLLESKP